MFVSARDRQGHRLQLFGCLTPAVLEAVRKDYTIEVEDDSCIDVTATGWYRESQARLRRGGLIRLLRSHREMSQGDLCKLLGVTGKFVSDLENGRRAVSVKMARKLSQVFGRRPERFLALEP